MNPLLQWNGCSLFLLTVAQSEIIRHAEVRACSTVTVVCCRRCSLTTLKFPPWPPGVLGQNLGQPARLAFLRLTASMTLAARGMDVNIDNSTRACQYRSAVGSACTLLLEACPHRHSLDLAHHSCSRLHTHHQIRSCSSCAVMKRARDNGALRLRLLLELSQARDDRYRR